MSHTDALLQRSLTSAEQLSLVTRAEATLTRAYYQSQSQADPTIEETAAHNRSAVAMNNAHDWSAVGDLLAMLEGSLAREQQGVLSEEDRREELKEHPEVAQILTAFEGLRADTIGAQPETVSSQYQLLSDRLAAFRKAESAEVAITAAAIEEFRGRVSGLVLAVLALPITLAIYFLWLLARQHDSLARAVSRQTKAHGEQRQVIVDCSSLGCGGVELLADAEWLTQAIMALVDNAIKASSAKQAVVIEFAAERVGWITVSVLDRGPGVREELIPNLGRPFFQQLDNAAGSGIGLGLSVAQWVAEQHGGALSLNNRDGGGLVAQIQLPAL